MIHDVINFTEEIKLNGTVAETYAGHVTIATPNSGGAKYARLHKPDGSTYLWSGDVEDVTEATTDDDPRWRAE